MYHILLLSQMSKLQFCSESNYAAIFQLNSFPGKILFLSFRLGIFFWKLGKKDDILDWEWGLCLAPGDREKRLCGHQQKSLAGKEFKDKTWTHR